MSEVRPVTAPERMRRISAYKLESLESNDPVRLQILLLDETVIDLAKKKERKVRREEEFIFQRGKCVAFTLYDSELWAAMSHEERHIFKGAPSKRDQR